MYALCLPISLHPVGSQENDDMNYIAKIWHYSSPSPTWGYGTDVKGHHRRL